MLVLEIKTKNFFYIFEGAPELWCLGTRTLVPQPFFGVFFWCHFKTTFFCNGSERRTILTGFQWISVLSIFSGFIRARTFIKRKTPTKLGHQGFGAHVPELWCPFEMAYRFFVSTNMGFRNRSLSFFSHLFRHSWLLLFLTEHYQHVKGFTNKISTNKSIGAPYLWCLGTRIRLSVQ